MQDLDVLDHVNDCVCQTDWIVVRSLLSIKFIESINSSSIRSIPGFLRASRKRILVALQPQ